MSSYVGMTPNNPLKYLGPNNTLTTVVTRNRAPTSADVTQPETGKKYPIGGYWIVGRTPTTGIYGDLWYLATIVANVATWQLISHAAGLAYFSLTPYIVGQVGDVHAQFAGPTAIQDAIDAASEPANVIVKPGLYTENLIHKSGVNVIAMPGSSDTPTVVIFGKNTFSSAGRLTIANILLQTNGDYCVEVSGNQDSILNLESVLINCSDNDGILYSSTSALSGIVIADSFSNIQTIGLHTFDGTGAGFLSFTNFTENNDFNSISPNTISSGIVQMGSADFGTPLALSGTASFNAREAFITCNPGPAALSLTGTATANLTTSGFSAGTSSAITIDTGCACTLIASQVSSNNTNAIGGTGTLNYNSITFTGASSQFDPGLTLSLAPSTPSNAASGFVWTSTGPNTAAAWQESKAGDINSINIQTITATGTYTPTAGMAYCEVKILGGGGAGGGAPATSAIQCAAGGSGGAGEYAVGVFSAATIGASQAITIGAGGIGSTGDGPDGGPTSIGALMTAFGGQGANAGTAQTTCGATDGGDGGIGGTGGNYRTPGAPGNVGIVTIITPGFIAVGGIGASSQIGSGGIPQVGAGFPGLGYGSGGSGASNFPGTIAATNGGNGAPGVVIITEYIA